ncbi:MAG: hypothetical protein COT14_00825 [Candidatus Diapherotrites archaeon CG08_land_8_20_14_0_20_30_16]|nr:MAG: hypothetical protein COT14_00825 [Candidatus Diapherotrites archaeon CG08_land_8_20_14_0_20_30_16]
MSVLKNVKVIILIAFLIFGVIVLASKGLKYGLDFSGGTQFILTLEESVKDTSTMDKVKTTIAQRLDWTGLKDVKVNSWDERFVGVQVAASDPKELAQIEELLQKQGRFECLFENTVLFTGDDVVSVSKDAEKGFGIHKAEEGYQWSVPFTLNAKAARNFSEGIFHKCVSLPDGTASCPSTFFFIDRPLDALVLIPKDLYDEESASATSNVKLDDLLKNSQAPYIIVDTLDANTIKLISDKITQTNKIKLIYPSTFDIKPVKDANLQISLVAVSKRENFPWTWSAIGLKTIIGLREDITNKNSPTTESANFKIFMNLAIEGGSQQIEEAQQEVNELSAILSSGSLPVGIENISKETVSPIFGQNILSKILIVGLIALAVIAMIIFFRYKDYRVALPIFFTGFAEIFLILCFAALIGWQLDLAAIAGILAAVGTGVDDQIIITDELARKKEEAAQEERSLLSRVKRAFFIIWISAATLAVTMLPIVFIFGGVPKLVGFAITTLAGVAIGVLITRPAYAVILKSFLTNK